MAGVGGVVACQPVQHDRDFGRDANHRDALVVALLFGVQEFQGVGEPVEDRAADGGGQGGGGSDVVEVSSDGPDQIVGPPNALRCLVAVAQDPLFPRVLPWTLEQASALARQLRTAFTY
ncbi:hypothetical protein ACTD5D_21420 [Nocardia takedensis]|uniref:hypothetical protein n=1 Tax=Nocardia takedensis TaxID=259390 RepID=UPI003F75E396